MSDIYCSTCSMMIRTTSYRVKLTGFAPQPCQSALALTVHERLWGTAKDQLPHLPDGKSIRVPALMLCGDDLMNSM